MYGEPALPPDLVSLPYANPDAPKGGAIVFGETGGFDSLNPFILRGRAPGNVIILASGVPLPLGALQRAAQAAVPREQVLER